MRGARSAGVRAKAPIKRQICRCPSLSAAAVTACGSASPALSTITRTAMKGSARVWATSAIARLSISTATALFSRNSVAFSASDPTAFELVSNRPSTSGRCADSAEPSRSRQWRAVVIEAPSDEITSLGRKIVPGLSAGSSPPAIPQLASAVAPASMSACALRAAAARPMPLTASSVPSASGVRDSCRRVAGPRWRASAASAQTTPTTFSVANEPLPS